MKFRQSARMAFSAVLSNKMRSFLTMLGIIIGVFSVTLLVSIVQSGTGTITDSMSGLGGNQVTVTITDRKKRLSAGELEKLEGTGGIEYMAPYLQGTATAVAGSNSEDITVYGITPSYESMKDMTLTQGRRISEYDVQERLKVCLLGSGIAKNLFGDQDPVDQTVRISGSDYTVAGVLKEEDDSILYFSIN